MTRLSPEHRRLQILNEAQRVARTVGLFNERFTMKRVADACDCSPATIAYYFSGRNILRDHVVEHSLATVTYDKIIVSQAITANHPLVEGVTI